MYEVIYHLSGHLNTYDKKFHNAWSAILKARMLFEEHGLVTDVMNCDTGEIIAIFEPDNTYVAEDLHDSLKMLALRPLN